MAHDYENTTTTQGAPNPHAEERQTLTEGQRLYRAETEAKEMAAQEIGSRLHGAWRASHLLEDGTYETYQKTTTDEAWIAERGTNTVDIANTAFQDLLQDWRQEYEDTARVLVKELWRRGTDWKVKDEQGEYTEEALEMASAVHGTRLSHENNALTKGSELDVSFDGLTMDEKLKYLAQVELVMELALGDRDEAYSAAGDGVEVFYNKFGVELGFEPYDEAYF